MKELEEARKTLEAETKAFNAQRQAWQAIMQICEQQQQQQEANCISSVQPDLSLVPLRGTDTMQVHVLPCVAAGLVLLILLPAAPVSKARFGAELMYASVIRAAFMLDVLSILCCASSCKRVCSPASVAATQAGKGVTWACPSAMRAPPPSHCGGPFAESCIIIVLSLIRCVSVGPERCAEDGRAAQRHSCRGSGGAVCHPLMRAPRVRPAPAHPG